jgi:capsular polysaccharide transport system ATP-binding protein
VLNSSSSAEPILVFDEFVLRADKSDQSVVISSPWNWRLNPGDRLSVMTTNSFLSYQLMATLSDFVKPISGEIVLQGSVSWPLGGQGGLDSRLTIKNGFEFLSSIYGDSLEKSKVSVDDFFDELKKQFIDPSIRLKDLPKDHKDFFFTVLSILFCFDICIAPHSRFLMSREARSLRNLLHKQLDGGLCMVSTAKNNRFRREFCNRGMVLGPFGEMVFDGNLEEAIAISSQNDIIENSPEVDENQFDLGESLTNSDPRQDIDF